MKNLIIALAMGLSLPAHASNCLAEGSVDIQIHWMGAVKQVFASGTIGDTEAYLLIHGNSVTGKVANRDIQLWFWPGFISGEILGAPVLWGWFGDRVYGYQPCIEESL